MKSLLSSAARSFVSARSVMVANRVPMYLKTASVPFSKFAREEDEEEEKRPTLIEVLPQEIAHESANEEIDQEYLDVKKTILKSFSLEESAGHAVVNLVRTHKNETITIKFDVQNETEDEEGFDQGGDEQEQEVYDDSEEAEDRVNYGIPFDASIQNKAGDKLSFECVAGESLRIVSVQHIPNGKKANDETLYFGPAFGDLEESLQNAFYDYLAERKVDDDLSFFVLSHSRTKEQGEYVNWLNKVLEFTAKK